MPNSLVTCVDTFVLRQNIEALQRRELHMGQLAYRLEQSIRRQISGPLVGLLPSSTGLLQQLRHECLSARGQTDRNFH